MSLAQKLDATRRQAIAKELRNSDGNMSRAARNLAIHRNTLRWWMRRLNIAVPQPYRWGGRRVK